MAPTRAQIPFTLPRSFTFHYTEGEEPHVSPESRESPPLPGPIRPRRRYGRRAALRGSLNGVNLNELRLSQDVQSADLPIPSIEIEAPSAVEDTVTPMCIRDVTPLASDTRLSTPRPSRPVTPLHNILPTYEEMQIAKPGPRWDDISRPSSVNSLKSDSSSDEESFYSAASGSATSPESDVFSSFGRSKRFDRRRAVPAPVLPPQALVRARQKRTVQWTDEMDRHLLATYHRYKRDPTTTPFQTTRGGVPPLGVCCKVAREAKRAWKVPRVMLDSISENHLAPASSFSGTWFAMANWPGSESDTRKRLRELIKNHHVNPAVESYRLGRLASFEQSRPRFISPEPREDSTFSTRSLSLNLMASTSTALDTDGPLMRMTRQSLEAPPFNTSSSQSTLGSTLGSAFGSVSPRLGGPRLGSPFEPARRHSNPPQINFAELQAPALAVPMSANKRRASGQLLDHTPEQGETRPPSNSQPRRVRTRGYSVGVVRHARAPLAFSSFSELSSQPSISEEMAAEDDSFEARCRSGLMHRLGSPFQPKPINPMQAQSLRSIAGHGAPRLPWMDEATPSSSELPQTTPMLFGNVRAADLDRNGQTSSNFETLESFEQRLHEFRERRAWREPQ